jgi:hypothetical protein
MPTEYESLCGLTDLSVALGGLRVEPWVILSYSHDPACGGWGGWVVMFSGPEPGERWWYYPRGEQVWAMPVKEFFEMVRADREDAAQGLRAIREALVGSLIRKWAPRAYVLNCEWGWAIEFYGPSPPEDYTFSPLGGVESGWVMPVEDFFTMVS